jgi:hypothetical protein
MWMLQLWEEPGEMDALRFVSKKLALCGFSCQAGIEVAARAAL